MTSSEYVPLPSPDSPSLDSELLKKFQTFNIQVYPQLKPSFYVTTDASGATTQSQAFFAQCLECLPTRANKTTPSATVYMDDHSWVCHHCSYHGSLLTGRARRMSPMKWVSPHGRLPRLTQTPLSKKLVSWFADRKITEATLKKHSVFNERTYIAQEEKLFPCIKFPYFFNQKLISIKSQTQNQLSYNEHGCESIFYNIDQLSQEVTLITENEIELFSLEEAGLEHVIAPPIVPGVEAVNYEDQFDYLISAEKILLPVKKFILAFSNTEASRRLEEELARRLGKERCWRALLPTQWTSFNHLLINSGPDAVKELIDKARPYPIKGIFEAEDVKDKINALYTYGLPSGVDPGWPSMKEHYTIKEGQWTLVTGIPGHGKSNMLDAMLVNIATNENWRFGMFSPENQPIERHFANLMEKYADAPFSFGVNDRMSEQTKNEAIQWVNDHFYVILPDEEEGNWSVDGILNLAKALVFRKGIKGLVIDPWNELDHSRSNGTTETEHISQALTKIRQFARSYGVHVWVVAHPAKLYKDNDGRYPVPTPYDVSGSSHWNNKADNAISVWRNRGGKDEEIADIHIQKIRFKEVGRVGVFSLRYNKVTGRFIDDVDQAKRRDMQERGLELTTADLISHVYKPR